MFLPYSMVIPYPPPPPRSLTKNKFYISKWTHNTTKARYMPSVAFSLIFEALAYKHNLLNMVLNTVVNIIFIKLSMI